MFKFTQNENLKQQLLDTDDKILVETNPADFLCSIGEELIYWGFTLMLIRNELK